MSAVVENDILNYYHNYCEFTIYFKKIILQADPKHSITVQDITEEFIAERNRVLAYIPKNRKRHIRTELNKIATANFYKVSHWNRKQKITVDMV